MDPEEVHQPLREPRVHGRTVKIFHDEHEIEAVEHRYCPVELARCHGEERVPLRVHGASLQLRLVGLSAIPKAACTTSSCQEPRVVVIEVLPFVEVRAL